MFSIIEEDLSAPGVHVLVIGVSDYPHLHDGANPTDAGMSLDIGQLTSAAKSASEFAGWILNKYQHPNLELKSLRVLLSPSEGEMLNADIQNRLSGSYEATRNNATIALREFKSACDEHKENVAIVYISGHGVQLTKHGATVLLHDVGSEGQLNDLDGAIDMTGVHEGMNHQNTAQNQFWFIDTCRQRPDIADKFESMKGALTLSSPRGSADASIMYLATSSEQQAFGISGGVSLFYKALDWSLIQKGAAEGSSDDSSLWIVTVNGLNDALPTKVKEYASSYNAEQHVDITGKISNIIFHKFDAPPETELTLSLIPEEAHATASGDLLYNANIKTVENHTDWPLVKTIKSGLYQVKVKESISGQITSNIINVSPPIAIKSLVLE